MFLRISGEPMENNNKFDNNGENLRGLDDLELSQVDYHADFPTQNQDPNDYQVEFTDEDIDPVTVTRDFRNIRLYMQIAGICGPISLIFGGILLGTVALIFAIMALRKVLRYSKRHDELGLRALYVRRFAILALVISAGCLIANIVFVITFMPQLTEMFTSGATGMSSSGGSASGGPSSTWG